MKIQVSRDACCGADDQLGPLEATFNLAPQATVADLVREIVRSGFLQYSSSHTAMTGYFGELTFVRVFGPTYASGCGPEFVVPGEDALASLIKDKLIRFRFD